MIWTHFFDSSSREETDSKSPCISEIIIIDIIFYVVWGVPDFSTVAHYLLSLLMRELYLLETWKSDTATLLALAHEMCITGHIPFSTRSLKSNCIGSFFFFLFLSPWGQLDLVGVETYGSRTKNLWSRTSANPWWICIVVKERTTAVVNYWIFRVFSTTEITFVTTE